MSNIKQKHKDYLIKNEIKDLTDLVNYVEILRNTSNLQGEDRQMLFDFAFLIVNEQSSLKSFFAENKNPSREFFNAFKKFAENEDKNSPTFMDEVLGESNYDSAFNGGFTSLKKEDWKVLEDSKTETAKEVPNFDIKFGHLPIRGKIITYYSPAVCKDVHRAVELKQEGEKDNKVIVNFIKSDKDDNSSKQILRKKTIVINRNDIKDYAIQNGFNEWFILGDYNEEDLKINKEQVGKKETEGKLHYELSWEFIEEMAKRMANNKSDKYPLYNWKQKINVQDLKDAINRHHIEVMKGNYQDGDEILGHIVQYACNSMMLWEQLKNPVK